MDMSQFHRHHVHTDLLCVLQSTVIMQFASNLIYKFNSYNGDTTPNLLVLFIFKRADMGGDYTLELRVCRFCKFI